MKKKVVYLTQWVARDSQKKYPHGWGFISPIVEFPQEMDAAYASKVCSDTLSNDEFICIGATAIPIIDGDFELLGNLPVDDNSTVKALSAIKKGMEKSLTEAISALRDIDFVLDHVEGNEQKVKDIKRIVLEKMPPNTHQVT